MEYLTFARQPLRKKFITFAAGVLFWLLVISAIGGSALIWLSRESGTTLQYLIPQYRATQKIARDLESLRADGYRMETASGTDALMRISEEAHMKISDIRRSLYAMEQGGELSDQDTGGGQAVFRVEPARGGGKTFVKGLYALMGSIEAVEGKMSNIKAEALAGKSAGIKGTLSQYNGLISRAIALSDEYAYRISAAYDADPQKIHAYLTVGLLVLSTALLMATLLLIVFTVRISNSVIKPVTAISRQIKGLGKGQTTCGYNLIKASPGDEIGRLAIDFNALMETMDSLARYKKAIEEDEDLADVYSRLGGEFKYYGFDEFTIFEVANSQNRMKPVYPVAAKPGTSCNQEILESCFLCRAKRTGHTVSSIEYPGICKYFLRGHEMEHICIPMMLGGTAGGVVQFLAEKTAISALRKEAVEGWVIAARRYIEESVPVIETKRLMASLKDSAMKDALTGLHNRRFLQECAENLVAGAMRRGKNIGLIMGDLDFFKQVNDIHGHNAGDVVLKETAQILKKSVRAADLVIRFGGEEFLIVLVDAAKGESLTVAEKIRREVEENSFRVKEGTIKKTISLGISEFPLDAESFWQCIKFADVALYEAKNNGRNKSLRFTAEMWKDEQF